MLVNYLLLSIFICKVENCYSSGKRKLLDHIIDDHLYHDRVAFHGGDEMSHGFNMKSFFCISQILWKMKQKDLVSYCEK